MPTASPSIACPAADPRRKALPRRRQLVAVTLAAVVVGLSPQAPEGQGLANPKARLRVFFGQAARRVVLKGRSDRVPVSRSYQETLQETRTAFPGAV